ncbi:MAG: VWA domain-containing protein, partial [Thermoanaerobaculia bacterium]
EAAMNLRTPLLLATILLAVAAVPSSAQQAPAASAERTGFITEIIDVRVINVEVFVTDRSGVPVAGLGPEAFELQVDGKPMPISNFYAEVGGLPRVSVESAAAPADPSFRPVEEVRDEAARRSYVVILIDHSRLGGNNRRRAFKALRQALSRLGREDLVAVVGVEGALKFYSDFLYDRLAIERILDDAERVPPASGVNDAERRRIFGELARGISGGIQARASQADELLLQSRIQAYAADEFQRSLSSLRQIELVLSTLAGIPGRKSLLYVGEGIPTRPGEGLFVEWRNRFGSGDPAGNLGLRRTDYNTDYSRTVGRYDLALQISQLALAANRAGVTMYAIDAEGDHGGYVRSALTEQGATSETLTVVNENFREPLESISTATGGRLLRSSGKLTEQLTNLLGDFDSFYSLGFTPPADWQPGSDHDIKVRVKGRSLVVRHRDDVAVPAPDEREAGATVAALRYHTADNPLEMSATPGVVVPRQDGNAALQVTIQVPIGNLELLPQDGTHAGSLAIYVSTKDGEGNTSRVQKVPFNLAIPDAVIERARGDSARYDLPVVLRPGDLQVAIGLRDNISGRFSAVRLDVYRYSSRL